MKWEKTRTTMENENGSAKRNCSNNQEDKKKMKKKLQKGKALLTTIIPRKQLEAVSNDLVPTT